MGKREIPFGDLVSREKSNSKEGSFITEIAQFKDSVECIKYYNQLVFQFSKDEKSYKLDAWTNNEFNRPDGHVRFSDMEIKSSW